MTFLLLLSINSVAKGVGDLSRVGLRRKRGTVATALGNASLNLIVRACQHRTIGRPSSIAASANVNNEKAERSKTQALICLRDARFDRKNREVPDYQFSPS